MLLRLPRLSNSDSVYPVVVTSIGREYSEPGSDNAPDNGNEEGDVEEEEEEEEGEKVDGRPGCIPIDVNVTVPALGPAPTDIRARPAAVVASAPPSVPTAAMVGMGEEDVEEEEEGDEMAARSTGPYSTSGDNSSLP